MRTISSFCLLLFFLNFFPRPGCWAGPRFSSISATRKRQTFPLSRFPALPIIQFFPPSRLFSCTAGTSQGCAEKMKALAVKAGYSCFMTADPVQYEDPEFTNNMSISLNLHRCKVRIRILNDIEYGKSRAKRGETDAPVNNEFDSCTKTVCAAEL